MVAMKRSWKRKRFRSGEPIPYRDCFSPAEFRRIHTGSVPKEMEDKWFIYYKTPYLYFHRSWTGLPVFRLRFAPNPYGSLCVVEALLVTANAKFTPQEAAQLVDFLIDTLLLGRPVPIPASS